MRIVFWGTRGSLPSPMNIHAFRIKAKRMLMNARDVDLTDEAAIDAYLESTPPPDTMTFGGNTPCVEVIEGNDHLILDCGSGIRELGNDLFQRGFAPGNRINILQTHTHWDHMMGFPFFGPAYSQDTEIHIYGVHPHLRERFEAQMDLVHFPITIDEMRASITFHQMHAGEEISLGSFIITNKGLPHPGGSYSYRIASGDKTMVFATDGEYTNNSIEEFGEYIEFYRNADTLIFDAMYSSLEKTIEKENFGHSTAVIGINIAHYANVRNLILFHHDPESNDTQIHDAFKNAQRYLEIEKFNFPDSLLKLVISYDGLVFDV